MRADAWRAAVAAVLLAAAAPAAGNAAVSPAVAAAAKTEGTVVWYSALDAQSLNLVVQKFNATHPGIVAQALQVGSTLIPARVMTEQSAHKVIADVVSGDQFSVGQLAEVGALQPFTVSDRQKFAPGSFDPNGRWAAMFSETTVIAWNPQKVRADGLRPPVSLDDLARPEWKGRLGIDSSAFNWYQAVLLTQKNASDTLKKIAANHPLITTGHTVTVTQLANGEFDATPTAYGYMVEQQRVAGLPVDFINLNPMLVNLEPVAIVKDAPHPNAARVLIDWLLSQEAQTLIAGTGHTSRRLDVPNNLRISNPKIPSFIMPSPDRNAYNTMVNGYKALLGAGN